MMTNAGIDTLIVDDEPLARNRLKTLCVRLSSVSKVRTASSGIEALKAVESDVPDLILLDVDMPDVSGIDVAEKCQLLQKRPEIIFTTAHSIYAVRAFRLRATDFLLKPVKQALLSEAMERVSERLSRLRANTDGSKEKFLWVKDGEGSVQIRCSDIGHIVAEQDYMRLCLADRSYLICETMQSLARALPNDLFVRIHRSTIVRKDFIKEIRRLGRRRFVVLKDETDLTIGASYADQFFSQAGGLGLLETVSE